MPVCGFALGPVRRTAHSLALSIHLPGGFHVSVGPRLVHDSDCLSGSASFTALADVCWRGWQRDIGDSMSGG